MSTKRIQVNDIVNIIDIDKLEKLHGIEITKTVIRKYLDDQENPIGYHLAIVKFGINPFTVAFNDRSNKNCYVAISHGTIDGVYLSKYCFNDDNTTFSVEHEYLDYNDLRSFLITHDIVDFEKLRSALDTANTFAIDSQRSLQ